ncbi:MAG: sigma-70 family RNA polymerase sigma factor [Candidatus Shapirobacteria bacterium]
MNDEEIVKLVVEGDIEKYGEIIERYEKRLRGFIKKLIGNNLEIDDLVENSLISAYQNLNGFDFKLKFSSWILRIAHNKTIDYIKKKKPKILGDEMDDIKEEKKLMEDMEIEEEGKKELHRSIDKLDIKYKEIIVLYYFEEKNYEEISDILHITTSNVGVMLNRAKLKLKQFLI